MIIGVDINNAKKAWGERFGMTHFVNPKEIGSDLVPYLVDMTKRGADQIGGADYTFDCTGNVTVMRQALEACHRGWGQSIIIGVAPAGAEIATRPFQLVTGRVWKGTAFGGARGRTDVPKIVDWYMDGQDRDRPDDHPHHAARRHQPRIRPDACRRIDPQRRDLLRGRPRRCCARQGTPASPPPPSVNPIRRPACRMRPSDRETGAHPLWAENCKPSAAMQVQRKRPPCARPVPAGDGRPRTVATRQA